MALVSMKRTKDTLRKLKEKNKGIDVAVSSEDLYPYGLRIRLEKESLDKLGDSVKTFKIGGKVKIEAMANIEELSIHEDTRRVDQSISLQITDLDLVPATKKPTGKTLLDLKKIIKSTDKE